MSNLAQPRDNIPKPIELVPGRVKTIPRNYTPFYIAFGLCAGVTLLLNYWEKQSQPQYFVRRPLSKVTPIATECLDPQRQLDACIQRLKRYDLCVSEANKFHQCLMKTTKIETPVDINDVQAGLHTQSNTLGLAVDNPLMRPGATSTATGATTPSTMTSSTASHPYTYAAKPNATANEKQASR